MTKTYQDLMDEATEAYENIKRITEAMEELATAVKEPKRNFHCTSGDSYELDTWEAIRGEAAIRTFDGRSVYHTIYLSKDDQRELIKTLQEGLDND